MLASTVVTMSEEASTPVPSAEELDGLVRAALREHPALKPLSSELRAHFERLVLEGCADVVDLQKTAPQVCVAFASARGHDGAVRILDDMLTRGAGPALHKMGLTPTRLEEVLQRVRVRLAVGAPGKPPRALSYAGTGPLEGWLRVVAVNTAYDLLAEQGEQAQPYHEAFFDAAVTRENPELAVYTQTYAAALHEAMLATLRNMDERLVAVLRFSLLEELSIDQIGAIYGVHRSTAARQIVEGKAALAHGVRTAFCAAVGIAPSEFDSLIKDLRSYLDFSVEKVLAQKGGEDASPRSTAP